MRNNRPSENAHLARDTNQFILPALAMNKQGPTGVPENNRSRRQPQGQSAPVLTKPGQHSLRREGGLAKTGTNCKDLVKNPRSPVFLFGVQARHIRHLAFGVRDLKKGQIALLVIRNNQCPAANCAD